MSYTNLTASENDTLARVSSALGINPEWLYKLIRFESRWDPLARNPISTARGLIQFTDTTARSFGYPDADDLVSAYPTINLQLAGPVLDYLKKYAPFPSEQSLTMAVFYPAFRYVDINTPFPSIVTQNNPGINSPADYMRMVFGAGGGISTAAIISIAIISGLVLLSLYQKGVIKL